METRASYIAVGSFVLVLILGLVGFVIWVGKFRGEEQFARYDILFDGSVTGLQVDGTVRYRGVPVGRITDIRIDPNNIEKIRVTIEIDAATPVRTDTVASIELQGITGVTYILLKGGKQESAALPVTTKEPYPQIASIPSRIELLFQTAPDLLTKANVLIERVTLLFNDENEKNISQTLANLRALSDRFANGGGNLDAMLESGKSALAIDPEILFLDEPTSGLDPIGAAAFDQLIRGLQQSLGLTVFMVTHDLDSLATICDRIAVLVDKRIKVGTMEEFLQDDHPWIREYFHGPRGRAARHEAH